ncbi:hypothetical protein [Acidisoma sp. L85]|uniref:hypothetical protein n=1 Tax=Acidisoma sp. L85 TaxID=1641850 RepID=UPI00131A6598|nr:hypothetical protein [Acidisoma sp. L85]
MLPAVNEARQSLILLPQQKADIAQDSIVACHLPRYQGIEIEGHDRGGVDQAGGLIQGTKRMQHAFKAPPATNQVCRVCARLPQGADASASLRT